ncbi:AMP-binding protein [Herbidospora yilanensis]|uniref:AMP-binding protein n=1 Tax=Herbidospora yilanensis TaxID=354426 RepID=UPI000781EF67|nr:AMP-binding protein [Herbidospora yilanensis]
MESGVTGAVFGRSALWADRPALIDFGEGRAVSHETLAATVRRAATGLVRRGTRPGQTAAVCTDGVSGHLTAVFAVVAAGGVALPLSVPDPAELLAHDVRLMFTGARRAAEAVSAAEASRVRQVVSFGGGPGATEFEVLLGLDPLPLPVAAARTPAVVAEEGELSHDGFTEAMALLDGHVRLDEHDVVLVDWPPSGSADLAVLGGLAFAKGAMLVTGGGRELGVTVAAVVECGKRGLRRI